MRCKKSAMFLAACLLLAGCGGAEEAAPNASGPDAGAAAEAPAETTPPPAVTAEDTAAPTPAETEPEQPAAATTPEAMEEMGEMGGGEGFGEPADPADADRVIDVEVGNTFEFRPDHFEVDRGEVVTFSITNVGDLEHEFVLGDEEAQEAMAEEMAAGDAHAHVGDMSNAVTVHGGETAELTWHFTTPGVVLVGCHVQGHWDAGMRGSVVVG